MSVSNYNKNKAAKLLGIHRTALYKKMKKFNIPITNSKL
jgi:transcriptional regulator of acetoin/glycerol metabolism